MWLRQRTRQAEVMDGPGLDPARHERALRGLARINFWSGSAGILWPPLAALARRESRLLRVLDIATGAGDVPVRLWRRARRAGIRLVLEGCDRSEVAVNHARRRAEQAGVDVRFFCLDALEGSALNGYDVVMSSLFLHHLSDEQAVHFLGRMAEMARSLVLVNDLRRGATGLVLAHLATRIFSRSDIVHTDGPRSVEAAFTPAETRTLAERAGLLGVTVERRWPCRWLLTWERA
jgi:2-polyprenyl-3-methyl-5-hydroxy-6-metoxy-1,4-benzoquinol methylase